MSRPGAVFLMYHELARPGRGLCRAGAGYARYVVAEADFRAQLERVRREGGISVSEFLEGSPGVVITFDDGCETDLLAAVPALEEMKLHATFYVVAGWIGQRGYLDARGLRELSDRGFEVGSHSMTHAYLTALDRKGLRREIVESKDQLEQLIGKRIDHISCPGGRWSFEAARVAREAGYRSMATSRVGVNREGVDTFRLARVAIRAGTSRAAFDAICQGRGLARARAQEAVLSAAKTLMGDSTYEKIRGTLLGR